MMRNKVKLKETDQKKNIKHFLFQCDWKLDVREEGKMVEKEDAGLTSHYEHTEETSTCGPIPTENKPDKQKDSYNQVAVKKDWDGAR